MIYTVNFTNPWEEWTSYYYSAQDYYDVLDEAAESPHMKVTYYGKGSWVYIEEEFYNEEEEDDECDYQPAAF